MQRSIAGVMVVCSMMAGLAVAQQSALVCPPASAGAATSCETFHYHVLAYRPDTRQFAELMGVNQFASQAACERARDAQMKRNLAVVDFFKRVRNQQQYEADRFGPCHCDMTIEKASAVYLTDAQRTTQVRAAEEVRLRVRERLLDNEVTSDNELVRGLLALPSSVPLLSGPKMVPLPATPATPTVTNPPDDLKATRAVDPARPAVASLDLPLVEPVADGLPPPSSVAVPAPAAAATPIPASAPSTADAPPAPAASPEAPALSKPATIPSEPAASPAPAAPAAQATDARSAADAADSFIEYETQRIQNVLKASGAISDETVKTKIFEACMQRIQLLSNLRSLIEGSGSRSRLAAAAQAAQSESERQAFVARLFGEKIAPLWSPKDATDVVLAPDEAIDAEPERVLRDGTGRFSDPQKKRALYVLLAHSQPTEDQQLWLVTIIDGFLR